MDSIFQCFGRKQREDSPEKKKGGCNCAKVDKVLQCKHCKSTLLGYWQCEGTDGADGGGCSKLVVNSSCMDSQSTSLNGDSYSDGHSPTHGSPPTNNGNTNTGFYMNDYRPSERSNMAGLSYMPVSKNDPNYNMGHIRRGKAVIFNFAKWNNTHFNSLDLKPREGSEKDKRDLVDCLKKLSFEVVCHDNLRRQRYDKVIEDLRKEDHSDADCLLIAVMTHGEKNSIYLSDGTLIPVNSVWEEFEANACPTLAGKPKIFIIQACRGKRYDHGTHLSSGAGQGVTPFQNDVTDSGTFSYVIPNAADIIVAFSCPLGHYSWRHPEKGSWFIQSLCEVFNSSAQTMELQSLLTTVAREVAVNYESNTTEIFSDKKKQVPSTSSTLIRNVHFHPKPFVSYSGSRAQIGVETQTSITSDQINGNNTNGRQNISLQEVQLAVATAQSVVAEVPHINGANRNQPEIFPMVSVLDTVEQSQTDNAIIVASLNSNNLIHENPAVETAADQPILPHS